MSSVLVLGVCFYVLAVLSCLFVISHLLLPSWTADDRATVYMHSQISTQEQESLAQNLKSWPEFRNVSLISPEEARKRTEALLGQWKGMLAGLGDNFFPPALEIQFQPETLRSDTMDALLAKIRQSPHVEEILYGRGQSIPMAEGTTAMEYLWWGGMSFMSVIALLILFYTSRMMVLSCRDVLEIYRLAGATELYNKAPFYLAGIIQGCAGAILAVGFSLFSATKFQAVLPPLLTSVFSLKASQQIFLSLGLLLCGTVFGWAGTWLALKKSA
jgi:cell division transport system permease protein